ncbi:exosome complex exonuclease Rrp41 [Candidatus Micrarchaeota archaeon]|nr:exosome complex exonuclease Rrp41 [Candidatus Micrarchaeota archaeon]
MAEEDVVLAKQKRVLISNGKRADGRSFTQLRHVKISAGVLKQADGSALIEWGRNKVLAAVYGPHEVFPKHLTNPYRALINARYIMTPYASMEEHGRAGPNRRSIEISKVAKHVFENTVLTQDFPKTMIDVHMEVLQSDGGTRVAAITAASVALADAGIPLRDLPCGVSVGKVEGHLIVDLDKYEDNLGDSDMPMIFAPRTGEMLLCQMDGMLTREEIKQSIEMALEASQAIHELQVNALKEKYDAIAAKANAEAQGNGNGSGESQ